MLFRMFATVVSATILSATLAQAQSVSQLGGPRNYPPAGFVGQQFVDNDGCVFLKAGFGGQVNWVPRVNASHHPLCGFPPTFGAAVAEAVAVDMAPDPLAPIQLARAAVAAPVIAAAPPAARVAAVAPTAAPPRAAAQQAPVAYAAPRRTLLSLLFGEPAPGNPIPLVPVSAPPVMASPVIVAQPVAAQPAYVTTGTGTQAQCWQGSPRLETVLLRSGGTALVCTRGDGTLTGLRSPLFPQGAVGAALTPRLMQGATLQSGGFVAMQTANAILTPPRGYKLAWKDDRLNPLRGIGTASGQAQQDQVWTRNIPAVLVAAPQVSAAAPSVTVSSMSAPASAALPNATYVQVGTFGQPANADGARSRLSALGLPVSTSQITRKGKLLQVVFAGPFATPAAAQAALTAARGAGFGDAILK